MRSKIHCLLVFSVIISASTICLISKAQSVQSITVTTLRSQLQDAVCLNQWNQAIELTGRLMGSVEITAEYRSQLLAFRRQLEGYRSSDTVIDNTHRADCKAALSAATEPAPTPNTTQNQPIDWDRAVSSIRVNGSSNSSSRRSSSADVALDQTFWRYFLEEGDLESAEWARSYPDGIIGLAHSMCGALARGVTYDGVLSSYGGNIPASIYVNIFVSGVYAYCPNHTYIFQES